VESFCEFGFETSGSIKYWETIECPNKLGISRVVPRSIELINLFSDTIFYHPAALYCSRKIKASHTLEDGHIGRNMYCKTATTKSKTMKHLQ
jgi:hypothetical protein